MKTIAEILAVFDDIAYRPNSYDFDKAATQLQQLIIEELENILKQRYVLDWVDTPDGYTDEPTEYISPQIVRDRITALQAQLNKEVE